MSGHVFNGREVAAGAVRMVLRGLAALVPFSAPLIALIMTARSTQVSRASCPRRSPAKISKFVTESIAKFEKKRENR